MVAAQESILGRGKSELRQAGCWVTPRLLDLIRETESATENYRPDFRGKGEKAR